MLNEKKLMPGERAREVQLHWPLLRFLLHELPSQFPFDRENRHLACSCTGWKPVLPFTVTGWGWGVGGGGGGLRPSHNGPKRPAVFLDRDGTINEEMGYINHLSRLRLLPEAAPGIRRLNEAHLPVVVITNQSGAARGYFPAALVDEVHARLQALLAREGARLDAIYTCLHGPEAGCACRKPRPGLLLQAARDLNLDISRSYVIGDRYKDIETAAHAGARGILVLTGYGLGEYEHFHDRAPVKPAHVAKNLLDAAEFIIQQENDAE